MMAVGPSVQYCSANGSVVLQVVLSGYCFTLVSVCLFFGVVFDPVCVAIESRASEVKTGFTS